jgi:hypothetical protein
MKTLAEFTEHVRDTRDRYYDQMNKMFFEHYQEAGTCFAISISFNPDEIYPLDLAAEKFKKAIGERGYKVVNIYQDVDLRDMRFTIEQMDDDVKSSKCIIS